MDMKELEQKVRDEIFDNRQPDFQSTVGYIEGYDRALRLVLRWIEE